MSAFSAAFGGKRTLVKHSNIMSTRLKWAMMTSNV
jgi:hypothetical protein